MLPIMGAPEDVDAVVGYLKTKATGATMSEAKATIDSKYLDGRKLSAYESWGLVSQEGDRVKLTDRGRRMARRDPEDRACIYGEIIRSIKPYRLACEWIFHQGFDSVPAVDLV